MKEFLKGNFEVKRSPSAPVEQNLTDKFEIEALRRLGGSITFVSKKKHIFGATPGAELGTGPTPADPDDK